MDNAKLSLDKDKDENDTKLLERLKAKKNKAQSSLHAYRKRIEASQGAKADVSKAKVDILTPSTSTNSLSSTNSKRRNSSQSESNSVISLNENATDRIRSSKSSSTSSASSTSKCNVVDRRKNDKELLPKNGPMQVLQSHGEDVQQKTKAKNNISKFHNNDIPIAKCLQGDPLNSVRHRSVSEKTANATEYANTSIKSSNQRERSKSGNFSSKTSQNALGQTNTKNIGSVEMDLNCNSNVDEKERKIRKRARGKRGSKSKTKETQANAEHIPFYAKECDSLLINAETLLILDLLYLPLEDHMDYLVDLAKARKIFLPNPETDEYVYNPELTRLKQILQLGNQCRNFKAEDLKKLEYIVSTNGQKKSIPTQEIKPRTRNDSESKRNGDKKGCKIFEDCVNEIVGENLPENKKEEYIFPKFPRSQRTKNYFLKPKFEEDLEIYARKLVAANLGGIVEGDVRINGKNNEQAFVKNMNGQKDAFLSSPIARKYALHGDIVRVFVRNNNDMQNPNSLNQELSQIQENIRGMILSAKQTPLKEPLLESLNETSESSNEIKSKEETSSSSGSTDKLNDKSITNKSKESTLISSGPSSAVVNGPAEEVIANEQNDEIDEMNNTIDRLLEQENEPKPEGSAKAFVIKIVEQVHNRKCVGNFLSYRKDSDYITFVPRDLKMPNIRIYKHEWPTPFKKGELVGVEDVLYVAQITEWMNGICVGKILNPIGKCGELESENKAILLQNGLEMDPYEERFNEMFYGPLIITEKDIKEREDLRSECIFTIDPLTARDLDDAMSVKKLENGNYEIGVHISDVTHFLKEKTELDEIVALRSTSVYVVNEVFHMLPKPLCFKCSLLPGEDKFAFSCFWEVSSAGDILKTRMSRTILNSCTQFAYEHAQKIIDNPDRDFVVDDFPQIHNGFSVPDIVERIKILYAISEIWRKKRFDDGALKINRPKLYFDLNGETGEPINYFQAVLDSANFLIEEFMLMANRSVAEFIHSKYPTISFLRNHEPPLPRVIQKVHKKLKTLGYDLDISSSKSIYTSLTKLIESNENSKSLEICLSHEISKPMSRARYFCSENATTPDAFWHYALSIPMYTHFTSPIRRYPDIVVHRVLAAALNYTEPPKRTPEELHIIAAICNEKKYTSKLAGEDSSNLYFMHYIKSKKSLIMKAAVLEVFFRSMEVLLLVSSHQIRVAYPSETSDTTIRFDPQTKTAVLITGNSEPIELKPFVEIDLEVYVEKFKIKARLPGTGKNDKIKADDEPISSNVMDSTASIQNSASSSSKKRSRFEKKRKIKNERIQTEENEDEGGETTHQINLEESVNAVNTSVSLPQTEKTEVLHSSEPGATDVKESNALPVLETDTDAKASERSPLPEADADSNANKLTSTTSNDSQQLNHLELKSRLSTTDAVEISTGSPTTCLNTSQKDIEEPVPTSSIVTDAANVENSEILKPSKGEMNHVVVQNEESSINK